MHPGREEVNDRFVDVLGDFVGQMTLAAAEETPLYETPRGCTDRVEPPVTHGPWPAASCAVVLRVWFDAGWMGLYLPDWPREWNLQRADWCGRLGDDRTLAGPDAEDLLAHPERWIFGHSDGHVAPYRTVDGQTEPWEQWYSTATVTAQRLPLKPT